LKKQAFLIISAPLMLGLGLGAVAQPASVASLTDVQGKVLVNQGRDFVPAQSGLQLKAGDRVLVLGDGAAKVVFPRPGKSAEGQAADAKYCAVSMKANSLYTVDGFAQCAKGTVAMKSFVQQAQAAAAGAAGAAGAGAAGAGAAVGGLAGIGAVGAGAIGIGAVTVGAAAATAGGGGGGGSNQQISPE